MKRILRDLSLLGFFAINIMSLPASAEVLAGLGGSIAFERSANGRDFETRQPWGVRGGFSMRRTDFYLEYQTFQVSDGIESMYLTRTRHEWLGWVKQRIAPHRYWSPFLAAGLGFEYEVIQTQFMGGSYRDRGLLEPVAALAAGLQANVTREFNLNLESRLAASAMYVPNPQFSLAMFAGLRF